MAVTRLNTTHSKCSIFVQKSCQIAANTEGSSQNLVLEVELAIILPVLVLIHDQDSDSFGKRSHDLQSSCLFPRVQVSLSLFPLSRPWASTTKADGNLSQ